ncbi:beta-L-arabinofuranosidase domain-containing protein [Cellulomonas sp. KH9]|uniref:beta-L-arabinofuranosidase domain-containing protein n=1 Tax=Cellulomonas sp. KH9 TaxID=1855324 RepID=UPI0008E889F8|nr:beta-L-arabinofuranosidase domain-containing protein [Cellulomonas sp. KH9]SFJ95732.1 hypothetical protein SAMN05216467_1400 [Cellulomonas sp. KH9]
MPLTVAPSGAPRTPRPVGTFPLSQVRLLDGPFRVAQDASVRYVLALDPDRLCAPYLREAGLPSGPGYGNWEGDGMGGHMGGHHLSACAKLWAATGDARLRDRLERVLDVLERCQEAVGTGYLGGVPGGARLGEELAAGVVDADTFSLNGRWVPLYNLHKTFAGLLDAATFAGSARAMRLAVAWAGWWLSVSRAVPDDVFEDVLTTEFGGMADAFATLAQLTGDPAHLAEARRFEHRRLLDPLAAGRDELGGLHANTQIAKVVGYARLADLTGEERYAAAADTFWRTVTGHRTLAIGGNSVREHFHDDPVAAVTDRQGPETCNTANMLELTALRFAATGDLDLLEHYERATYNHVLSSQHPQHGGLVYFTPLRPAHYRVYSQPETSMWCCVGTGTENHAGYGALVFSRYDDDLAVNLYLGAELDWAERGATVRVEADLHRSDVAVVRVAVREPVAFALRLRRPGWASEVVVEEDGAPVATVLDDGHLVVRRTWSGERTLTVRFTTGLVAEPLPGDASWVAYRWGPVVLAARDGEDDLDGLLAGPERMGHVAAGPVRPLAATPVVVGDPARAVTLAARDPLTVDLTVRCAGADVPTRVRLEPFTRLHDVRYTVYWPVGEDADVRRARLTALDASDAPRVTVLDEVAAGEQQPESDHGFAGEGTRARSDGGTRTRSARGWFSYALRDPEGRGRVVRVTYRAAGADDPRAHEVRLGPAVVQPAATAERDGVVHEDLPVDGAARTDGLVVVTVLARDGLPTPDVTAVQLLAG